MAKDVVFVLLTNCILSFEKNSVTVTIYYQLITCFLGIQGFEYIGVCWILICWRNNLVEIFLLPCRFFTLVIFFLRFTEKHLILFNPTCQFLILFPKL